MAGKKQPRHEGPAVDPELREARVGARFMLANVEQQSFRGGRAFRPDPLRFRIFAEQLPPHSLPTSQLGAARLQSSRRCTAKSLQLRELTCWRRNAVSGPLSSLFRQEIGNGKIAFAGVVV